jgi:hypothetical protein
MEIIGEIGLMKDGWRGGMVIREGKLVLTD